MTSALSRSIDQHDALINTAVAHAVLIKKSGGSISDLVGGNPYGFANLQDVSANKRRLAQFRGWVYSAVNAIGVEAAEQPVQVGAMTRGKTPKDQKAFWNRALGGLDHRPIQDYELRRFPSHFNKAAASTIEVIRDHPLVEILDRPNQIQYGWQFKYSFIANLCLTGWGYIIGGVDDEGRPEFFSVPTSWVVPDHSKGAFAQIRIQNPRMGGSPKDNPPLDRSQFTFAYLPNPADPMSALAPATAQSMAVKIDESIQLSQTLFFDNSVFPGAIVTMGKNPNADGTPGAYRPRLTSIQRRQIYAAIRKVMSGVHNYGNPVIIDGMIESIQRLSAKQNEIGWEKSEEKIRARILSAYAVHPFILGESQGGAYAQAFVVEKRFLKRVNSYLSMLSEVMTEFVPRVMGDTPDLRDPKLLIWWEEARASDPSLEKTLWEGARTRGDVTQNEFRGFMGLPPDEDKNQATIPSTLAQSVSVVAGQVTTGKLNPEQAIAILEGFGLPTEQAKKIAGTGPGPNQLALMQKPGKQEIGDIAANAPKDETDLGRAAKGLQRAIARLTHADDIVEGSKGLLAEIQ